MVFDKNLQRILIDCLDQSNVRKYLAERILPPLQEYFRNGDWESFEQVLLSYLQKSLADFFRNILIDSLEEKERYQAWKHKPNREYFKIKYPEQTFHFIDNEVNESIIEILNKIQLVAFDTEIRDEKIREIGVYYTNGEAKEWMSDDLEQFKQEIIQNDQIQVLAGHNLHFDIEYLHSHQLMTQEKKLIDTLILQSILYPCSRHSLRLEDEFRVGRHQAKVDAEDTLSRLSKQILLLARHSSETLEKWISLASPGLHQLFECIQEYRLSISLTDYVVKTEDDQENPPYWDKWMQTLDFVQTDIKTLLICPLSMMPELGVMIPNSTILDPDGYYLEEPNGLRINLLIERQKDKNSQINDLFVYISAFVQYARKHNQTSYLECCADWARYLLKDKKYSDLLASVCVSYETIFDQYQHQGSLNTIVPYSALANNKLVKLLTSKNFDRVLICDEEYAYKESNTDICSLKTQEIDKILPPGLNTIGLTQQEAENLDEDIPHGWRAWVKYSPREGWRLYKALADTQEYLKTIFNDSVKIEAYSLNTTDSKAYFQSTSWKISEQQVLLPPDSIYRADYLAQVGSAIISLFRQNKQRILVLLRNDDEKNYFKKVLSEQGVYIPEGTRLVQMERMEKRGFGLAIDSTKHALKWVFSARNNGTKQAPFDIVCLESWPLEDPIWFPQPTKKDLINLGKPKQDNPDEDNDINSDDDNEEAGEDNGIINISGERIRSREFLLHQLKHHFKLVVPLLSIAKELSFSDLYVLDSRFNRKLYENNEFSIGKDLKIELDNTFAKNGYEK